MHRRPLIELLSRYAQRDAAAAADAGHFRAFVDAHADCLLRSCVPGHITASAWIVSQGGTECLLTHHRKLDRWLQLGGHVDGEQHVERAALREAVEESGMERFELLAPGGVLVPLDLDVHPIPARGSEPAHQHWDVRFLLRALPGQNLVLSSESKELRWVPRQELAAWTSEESVLRLERTSQLWWDRGCGVVSMTA
jgi:8-oxo-dGTP pyrophosphatase MutT (NUDIX family)